MLVLSRRLNEKLFFPSSQTTLQVVAIKPGVVRLGIEAPANVSVFREELMDRIGNAMPETDIRWARLREWNHVVRNCLNVGTVGVALLARQLAARDLADCEETIRMIATEFTKLRQYVDHTSATLAQERARPVRRKALLVEDDQNERELLAGFLRMAGLDVATADDGSDALDYLRSEDRPDVVLLDMMLPRCDGPTTVRQIRDNPNLRDLKIFAVSGYEPDQFGLEAGHTGVDRWFRKPLNPERLLHDLQQELA